MDSNLYEEHEAFYLLKAPQRSQIWLESRRVTASNFATARGLNPYEEAEDYASQLKGAKQKRKLTDLDRTRIQHGIDTEPIARQYYEEQTGRKVTEISLVVSKAYPKLGGSPDGVVIKRSLADQGTINEEHWERLIEIKCPMTYPRDYPRYPPQDSWMWIPTQYYDQIQGCMMITGVPVCDLVVYCKDYQLIHPVKYNPSYARKMLDDLLSFIRKYDI